MNSVVAVADDFDPDQTNGRIHPDIHTVSKVALNHRATVALEVAVKPCVDSVSAVVLDQVVGREDAG